MRDNLEFLNTIRRVNIQYQKYAYANCRFDSKWHLNELAFERQKNCKSGKIIAKVRIHVRTEVHTETKTDAQIKTDEAKD